MSSLEKLKESGICFQAIGGNHSRLAFQDLVKEFPSMKKWKTRKVYFYSDLSLLDAELIGLQHNFDNAFHHEMSRAEKVLIYFILKLFIYL